MSRSRIAAITSMTIIGVLSLQQQHLSTQNPQSPYYWRNLHLFSDMIFQLAHHKHVDFILSLSKLIVAADFNTQQFIDFISALPKIKRLRILFDKLDDIVDESTAEAVLSHGAATLSTELSPFLHNLLDQNDHDALNQLIEEGLITKNDMISFCNLMANKLYIQAELTQQYARTNDSALRVELRKRIAKENLEITGCNLALFVHFIKKDPRLSAIVNDRSHQGLTYDDVKAVYEHTTTCGELLQIAHDIPEFRLDLRQEPTIGKISANSFLAELEAANVLPTYDAAIRLLPDRPVNENELPAPVQSVFSATEKKFKDSAGKLGTAVRVVYGAAWHYEKLVGFFADKPRRHVDPVEAAPKLLRSKL